MSADRDSWFIVFRPDGVVIEASGGAPASWVGRPLHVRSDIPAAVRSRVLWLLDEARVSGPQAWIQRSVVRADEATGSHPDVELLLLEAVPLRRTGTRLFEILARTTETLVEQAHATEVSLKLAAEDGMPEELWFDGEKIAWGVAALVGSALRHVQSSPAPEKIVRVEAGYRAKTREVAISVRDNGPGIPQEKLEWLVRRNPETQKAAGLALLLLHDDVAAHGGSLSVQSSTEAIGHGTTVTMILPGE